MKLAPQDLSQLAVQLRKFLTDAGWTQGRQTRGLTFFYPPEALGIQDKYSIALPEGSVKPGVANLLHGAANSLVDIYGYGSLGDLLNRAASLSDRSLPTRLVTRFVDETIRRGVIPLASLASYTSNIEAGLYRSAKFKLGADTKESKLIAQRFVKDCLFLQTEQGSFIAKVEVPNTVLRQGDLFGG